MDLKLVSGLRHCFKFIEPLLYIYLYLLIYVSDLNFTDKMLLRKRWATVVYLPPPHCYLLLAVNFGNIVYYLYPVPLPSSTIRVLFLYIVCFIFSLHIWNWIPRPSYCPDTDSFIIGSLAVQICSTFNHHSSYNYHHWFISGSLGVQIVHLQFCFTFNRQ